MAVEQQLTELLEPSINALGYELLLLEMIRGKGLTLRIYIDSPDGIGVEACEEVSHQVSAVLDVEDPITSEYSLEVSSPGWDRPLVKAAHFQAYIGERCKVMLHMPKDGRRKYTGFILACDEQVVQLQVDNDTFTLDLVDIERARLSPEAVKQK